MDYNYFRESTFKSFFFLYFFFSFAAARKNEKEDKLKRFSWSILYENVFIIVDIFLLNFIRKKGKRNRNKCQTNPLKMNFQVIKKKF